MNNQIEIKLYNSESLTIGNYRWQIPPRTAKLLYLSKEDPKELLFGNRIVIEFDMFDGPKRLPPEEPSTIYFGLSVREPHNKEEIPSPDYYPTYAELSPEQKWIYLNWLRNVADSICIGYVFVYYYGLERQLLIGEFDLAFEEILMLRKYHKNNSFLIYSSRALLYSCIFRKRQDRLEKLYRTQELQSLDNTGLLVAHYLGYDLSAESLMNISHQIHGVNRRYLKLHPELFSKMLSEILKEQYGEIYFPFAGRYKTADLPNVPTILFANISFPEEIRTPEMPNFFAHKSISTEIKNLLDETHERVKIKLKEMRKRK